jgi:hypothetical protein
MAKLALHVLASGLVLDRAVFTGQTASEMFITIGTIAARERSKRFMVIDSATTFFTSENLLNLIKKNDADYVLVAEQAGVVVTDEQVAAIQIAESAQAAIALAMKPKWNFAEVPAGWSFAEDVSFGATTVKRKRQNPNGDGVDYRMTPSQCERIWKTASKRWAKIPNASPAIPAQHWDNQNHYKSGTVSADHIQIGCQYIRRYELEQIASHKGWAFPELA